MFNDRCTKQNTKVIHTTNKLQHARSLTLQQYACPVLDIIVHLQLKEQPMMKLNRAGSFKFPYALDLCCCGTENQHCEHTYQSESQIYKLELYCPTLYHYNKSTAANISCKPPAMLGSVSVKSHSWIQQTKHIT